MTQYQFGEMYYIKFNGLEYHSIIGIIGNNGNMHSDQGESAVFITLFGGKFYQSANECDVSQFFEFPFNSFKSYLSTATPEERHTNFRQTRYFKNFKNYYDISFNTVSMGAFSGENPENIQHIRSKKQLQDILQSLARNRRLHYPLTFRARRMIEELYDASHPKSFSAVLSSLTPPLS